MSAKDWQDYIFNNWILIIGTRNIPPTVSTSTNSSNDDLELQEGIRRSLSDRNNESLEDNDRPPPYNPDYNEDHPVINNDNEQSSLTMDDIRNARLRRFQRTTW